MHMLGARVPKRSAEGLKKYLQKKAKLDSKHKVFSSNSFIYFPLLGDKDAETGAKLKEFGAKFLDEKFERIPGKLKRNSLAPEGAAKGYDIYGSIAVIDAEPAAAKKMAKRLMAFNRNIKTVLRKGGPFEGKYRTRKLFFVAGMRNYVTEGYKENGAVFRFDLRKVFFTPRLGYERKRISGLVKDGENVMVMFAGIGPYAIEIAKSHRNCRVVAIELNKAACKHMRENILLNKTPNVVCEEGDVNGFVKKYRGFADRIIMPLPKDASSFLPAALAMSKERSTIHCYRFCQLEGMDETLRETRAFIEKSGAKVEKITYRTVLPYSSTEVEIVLDISAKIKRI
jgi:tRNA (guanine37-N1)-methyltransferase